MRTRYISATPEGAAPPVPEADRRAYAETALFKQQLAQRVGLPTAPQHDAYDVVVVGAGPAGLTSALYAASEGLRTLVVEAFAPGGQAGTSARIENYPGFPDGIGGAELAGSILGQARPAGGGDPHRLSSSASGRVRTAGWSSSSPAGRSSQREPVSPRRASTTAASRRRASSG